MIPSSGTPRPLWRWWLFCAAVWTHGQFGSRSRIGRAGLWLLGWCVLPEWLGYDENDPYWNDDLEGMPF